MAIESGSLYLTGSRAAGGTWFEFAPDTARSSPAAAGDPKPRLPGSQWVMVGSRKALLSYRALRLTWNIKGKPGALDQVTYAEGPSALLRFFRHWDGQLVNDHARISLYVLILVVCEALRFRSIEKICARWIRAIDGRPGDPSGWPVLTITRAMLDTVQHWHRLAAREHDNDVWTWPPHMPDRLVT